MTKIIREGDMNKLIKNARGVPGSYMFNTKNGEIVTREQVNLRKLRGFLFITSNWYPEYKGTTYLGYYNPDEGFTPVNS